MKPQRLKAKPVDFSNGSNGGRDFQGHEDWKKQDYSSHSTMKAVLAHDSGNVTRTILEVLGWVSAALGLLPGGAAELRASCLERVKFSINILAVGVASTTFVVVEGK